MHMEKVYKQWKNGKNIIVLEYIRLDTYFLSSYHFCTVHHLQDQTKKQKTIPTESCFEVLRYIHMKAT